MKSITKTLIAVLAAVAMVGIGVQAYAGRGHGAGHGKGYGMGQGCMGQGYGMGYHGMSSLSEEDIQKIQEERTAFQEATREIRQQLYEKSLELETVLAKEQPDAEKAAAIQKEISQLETEFDQKRLDHVIKMKKINPNAGRGFARGFGGKGCMRASGGMMGGGHGRGCNAPCWR